MDITYDLKTNNGDLEILNEKDSTYQAGTVILYSAKGNIINRPTLGVDIIKYLNGPLSPIELKYNINTELNKDGIKTNYIVIENNQINIEMTK